VLPFTLDTGAVYVTAHVCQLKLVTHPVGARISFQLLAVEYGATLNT